MGFAEDSWRMAGTREGDIMKGRWDFRVEHDEAGQISREWKGGSGANLG